MSFNEWERRWPAPHRACLPQARTALFAHLKPNCDCRRLLRVTPASVLGSAASSVITILAPACAIWSCSAVQFAKSAALNCMKSLAPKPVTLFCPELWPNTKKAAAARDGCAEAVSLIHLALLELPELSQDIRSQYWANWFERAASTNWWTRC
jgi:hypothetical protein